MASRDRPGGRFDLTAPAGTCYLADSLTGALLEKVWRVPKQAVPTQRLAQLFHARIRAHAPPPLADLTDISGTGRGLNAEIHTTLDYRKPRAWAGCLRQAGWRGLRYLLRGDVAVEERGLAIFGGHGLHQRAPAGFRTEVGRLDQTRATDVLRTRGIQVRPIPMAGEVPTVPAEDAVEVIGDRPGA